MTKKKKKKTKLKFKLYFDRMKRLFFGCPIWDLFNLNILSLESLETDKFKLIFYFIY